MVNSKNSLDVDIAQILANSAEWDHVKDASQGSFDLDIITKAAIHTIQTVQQQVDEDIATDPVSAFEPLAIGTRGKPLLAIDLVAERNAARELHRALASYSLLVLGEESLRDQDLDLTAEQRLVVLVPHDAIYFATNESSYPRKYRYHGGPAMLRVSGPSAVKTIEDSSLAFYGQKPSNLSSVVDSGLFAYLAHLHHVHSETRRELKTRVYNIAGNPIAMKLIDGPSRVDAVFDLHGQAPHDIVPGAFIAQKAGASFCDLNGRPIDLNQILLRPADRKARLRYILASTQQLSVQLRQCILGTHWEVEHPRPVAA